jgi:hypothetical protein
VFLFPATAALVAGSFAVATWRAARMGGGALRVWAFALLQFAIACVTLFWGVAFGWTSWLYRIFYAFGAVLNIAWLGLGTVRLFIEKWAAAFATGVVVIASAYAAYRIGVTNFLPGATHALRAQTLPAPKEVIPDSVRALGRWFSIGGSIVVLGGLVWSLVARRRHSAGLALLAAGVVVVGVAGELARVGLVTAFSALLAGGILLMYAGFVRTRSGSD